MQFKGTPGPWLKEVRRGRIVAIIPDRKYSPRVIENLLITGTISEDDCGNPTCCCVEEHANAQLISAAPDLLEALQHLILLHSCEQEGLEGGQPTAEMWIEAVNKAGLALTKAIGEEVAHV